MWANLLASAVSHYQSRQVLFIDLLGKLSTADARMIKLIYSRIRKEDWYTETADVDLWNIEECHIISENAAERLERRGDVLLNAFNDKVMICPPSTFDGLEELVSRASGARTCCRRTTIFALYMEMIS